MEILEHVAAVQELLQDSPRQAMAKMAESLADFLTDEALTSLVEGSDGQLVRLAGLVEGDPHAKDALAALRHARQVHKDPKSSLKKKVSALDGTMFPLTMVKAKSELGAMKGDKKAATRNKRIDKIGDELAKKYKKLGVNVDEGAADDLRAASQHAHMANWRAQQLKKKLATKQASPKPQLKYSQVVKPKTEGFDLTPFYLGEGEYHPDVKRASMVAANATRVAKGADATHDHHGTAATLHKIAHDVAKMHGHDDLAAKHLDLHGKHSSTAKGMKKASGA